MQLDLFKDVKEKIDWKDPVQVREYRRKYYQEYNLNNKEERREYRLKNKEKIRESKREYRLKNKEKLRESKREYRINNIEKVRKSERKYYEARSKTLAYKEMRRKYKQTPEFKELKEQWRKANPASVLASWARRRGRKRKAIPKWLNDCPIERMRLQSVYNLARMYAAADGIKRHVDHMWPLSDGGVHWSGNLQILTAVANMEKGSYSCPKLKKQIKLNLKEACNQNNRKNL